MARVGALLVAVAMLLAACGGSVVPGATSGGGGGNGGVTPSPTVKTVTCPQEVLDFVSALEDLNSRLDIGLNFQDYSTKVGDIKVVYDKIPVDQVAQDCLANVGAPAEDAFNDYVAAYNTWNDCIGKSACTNASITPKLQAKWADATAKIDEVKKALGK